jgi:hypothetical protein
MTTPDIETNTETEDVGPSIVLPPTSKPDATTTKRARSRSRSKSPTPPLAKRKRTNASTAETTQRLQNGYVGSVLGEGALSIIDGYFRKSADLLTPDVHYDESAIVPFRLQYNRSITPSEKAKVVDDWNNMIIVTQNMCKQALVTPPFEMQTHPSNSIAKCFRYEEDGRLVVEIHFNMFLGADRAEVQALKAEMQRNKEEAEKQRCTDKEETEKQRCTDKEETEKQLNELREAINREQRASSAERRESSAERQQLVSTITEMQKIIEQTKSKEQMVKEKRQQWNLTYKEKHAGCVATTTTGNNEPSLQCTQEGCNKTFLTEKKLLKHSRYHKPRKFKCTNIGCREAFPDNKDLRRHKDKCKCASA